jgi:hypothetical protein
MEELEMLKLLQARLNGKKGIHMLWGYLAHSVWDTRFYDHAPYSPEKGREAQMIQRGLGPRQAVLLAN